MGCNFKESFKNIFAKFLGYFSDLPRPLLQAIGLKKQYTYNAKCFHDQRRKRTDFESYYFLYCPFFVIHQVKKKL